MLKDAFTAGPFIIRPAGRMQVAGEARQLFDIEHGLVTLRSRVPVQPGTQAQVLEQIDEHLSAAIGELRREHERSHRIDLVDVHGESLASFRIGSYVLPGMTAGLIDDRSAQWLRSADRLYSQDVTLNEYARLRAAHELPARAWIADLLDEEILTLDSEQWRAPTAWELRHVIGVGSLTGITGTKAAELVGVTPQNFRKYTAKEGARTRQNMGFAMWHMLLHRLEIQRLPEGWA